MGVPAFFAWLAQKYPWIMRDCIEKKDEDPSQPNPNGIEFDNLYLDMNGIIHPCCHPEDKPAPATEEEMYHAVFEMLDRMFLTVRPRKLLYMAIDGVAPRAKMNQQRARRFRTAQEREEKNDSVSKLRAELISQGQKLPPPKDPSWDHNVITPGTKFMDKLSQYLRYYIHSRLNKDPAWAGVAIILSDATVPGEGEHKLVKYIRLLRAQKNYDPSTSHVIAGEDADLIMLGLAMHESRFFILREQKFMGRNQCWNCGSTEHRTDDCRDPPPEKAFQFLDISVLRQCLEHEYKDLGEEGRLSFPYSFESILDDFIFMCFWVGNDFLPHLPSLDIRDGGLDLLMELYVAYLPKLPSYLSTDGEVNLPAVKMMLQAFGSLEDEILQKRARKEKSRGTAQNKKQCRGFQNGNCRFGDSCGFLHGSYCPKDQKTDRVKETLQEKLAAFKAQNDGELTMKMPGLSSFERRLVHQLAGEMDLAHESQGVGADRCIWITKDAPPGGEANSEVKEEVGEAGQGDSKVAQKILDAGETDSKVVAQQFLAKLKKSMEAEDALLEKKLDDGLRLGEGNWKQEYYKKKFGRYNTPPEQDVRQLAAQEYVRGMAWVFRYYFDGCASWNWYFPYHYAPFAADMGKFCPLENEFEKGTAFPPMGQLMSVLPAASGHCLPDVCVEYMSNPDSEIIDLYPTEFELDSNGIPARRKWQWVILLPFSDQTRVLTVLDKCKKEFTEDENRRNELGKELIFVHSSHPIAMRMRSFLEDAVAGPTKETTEMEKVGKVVTVSLPAGASGLSGKTSIPLERWEARETAQLISAGATAGYGEKVLNPDPDPNMFPTIESSEVFAMFYTPADDIPHICSLIPGATPHPASTIVTKQDIDAQLLKNRPREKLANLRSARRFVTNALGMGSQHRMQSPQQQQYLLQQQYRGSQHSSYHVPGQRTPQRRGRGGGRTPGGHTPGGYNQSPAGSFRTPRQSPHQYQQYQSPRQFDHQSPQQYQAQTPQQNTPHRGQQQRGYHQSPRHQQSPRYQQSPSRYGNRGAPSPQWDTPQAIQGRSHGQSPHTSGRQEGEGGRSENSNADAARRMRQSLNKKRRV